MILQNNKIDNVRLARQQECVKKWISKGGKGTVVAATGFGKTTVALIAINAALKKNENFKIAVVVPNTKLHTDWSEKNIKNTEVYTIQYLTYHEQADKLNVDMVVIDEIHLFPSETFSNIFKAKYRYVLGLTGTYERLDGKEEILNCYAPKIDEISYDEAAYNGWVEKALEYVLHVEMYPEEKIEDNKTDKWSRSLFKFFDYEYNLARACQYKSPRAQEVANNYGMDISEIVKKANQWSHTVAKRKTFHYNLRSKLDATEELIKQLDKKTVVFGESIDFANKLYDRLKDTSILYHSQIPGIDIDVNERKEYKTEKAAISFAEKTKGKIEKKNDLFVVTYKKNKRLSGKKRKEYELNKLKDNRYKINTVISAKALVVGFDIQDMTIGIITSRTRSKTVFQQQRGRIVRKLTNFKYKNKKKIPIIINIVSHNSNRDSELSKLTQDEKWLNDALSSANVTHFYNVKELIYEIERIDNNGFGEEEPF